MKALRTENFPEYQKERDIREDGPWNTEPDLIEWRDKATGYACLIVRNQMLNLCGYVGVPAGHPWFGKSYSQCLLDCEASKEGYCEYEHELMSKISVHGGLTYSDKCDDHHICHVPQAGEGEVWWFGFDCAHCMDYVPKLHLLGRTLDEDPRPYRNVAYVEREVTKLARQLKEQA